MANGCSAHTDCGSCSGARSANGPQLCFWCYDSGACLDLQSPVSFDGVVNASAPPPLHGCKAWTFSPQDCECQNFKSCETCATLSHALKPICEWTETVTSVSVGGRSFDLGSRVGCRLGQPDAPFKGALLGPGIVKHNLTLAPTLSLEVVETSGAFYFAQCKLQGAAPMAIFLTVAALTVCLLVCVIVCCVRYCSRKRRRAADDWGRLYAIDAPMLGSGNTLNGAASTNGATRATRFAQHTTSTNHGEPTPQAPASQGRTVRWRQ